LPVVAARVSDRSLTLGRIAIVVTVLAWLGYLVTTILREFFTSGVHGFRFVAEAVSYLVIVSLLTFSALSYLATRQGHFYRTRSHRRVPRAEIDSFFEKSMPTLTVLVPSYREDVQVVRKTLLSAALQEFPYMRVVLLIDDPPAPTDASHRLLLEEMRALPGQLGELLAAPAALFAQSLERFEHRLTSDVDPSTSDMEGLIADYREAARWLGGLADDQILTDHTDVFFADHVLRRLAGDLDSVAEALGSASLQGIVLTKERLLQLSRRLAWIFRAELSTFERKQYVSLSSEPNKAMNLNSYIGLMGHSFRQELTAAGRVLRPCLRGSVDLEVPDPDYVLTLDADSILLPEYCVRLVHLLEQPHNARVAVAQTPYSAYPGASTRLERIAGATTDLQHMVHQGMSYFDATFWVGANAVLRKRALNDIAQRDDLGGFEIIRFIQDRTVIEDTESSIDLGVHGWTLMNYPERMSYSSTPPDFGSLCVQRQRWADGGLLILPKLWRHSRERRRRGERTRMGELCLRINYMGSICWSSFSLVILLVYPYDSRLLSPLVFLAALPYFLALAGDLRRCGYKRLDVLRIYGFNLVLLPVNLAGVFNSLRQGITGKKIPFARTPKVRNRTSAAVTFVVTPYLLVALAAFTLWRDVVSAHWENAVFAGTNSLLAFYAIVAYVGLRNSVVDVVMNMVNRLFTSSERGRRRQRKAQRLATGAPQRLDWEAILYYGTDDATLIPPSVGGERRPPSRLPTGVVGAPGQRHGANTRMISDRRTAGERRRSQEPYAGPDRRTWRERRASADRRLWAEPESADAAAQGLQVAAAGRGGVPNPEVLEYLRAVATVGEVSLQVDGTELVVSARRSEA
jgi:cellulose synthase (UDP-forming)